MKNELISEPTSMGEALYEITIRLIPENKSEAKAIHNFEMKVATEDENTLINNYLLFSITGWSTLSIKSQKGNIFKVKATNI